MFDRLIGLIQKTQIKEKLRETREELGVIVSDLLSEGPLIWDEIPPEIQKELLGLTKEILVLKDVVKKIDRKSS
jgi:hypothetical protein